MRRFLPLLLLLAYGGAFAFAAFAGGLPAFDDHPGQYFRLWHALERSLPDGRWTADWNPDWWGGYPELAFYPPGFVLAGAGIRLATLWHLSPEHVYQLLCALVLLLPAAGTFALLARSLGDPWLALPPAFLALTLSAGLRGGVEESVRWGMLTSRLAVAGLPFLALAWRRWIEEGRAPVWAAPAAAAVVLAHPAGAPAVGAGLGLAAWLAARGPARGVLRTTAATGTLALVLTAFWTLPLLARRAWVVPLTWGEATLAGLAAGVRGYPVLLAVGALAPLGWLAAARRRRRFDTFLAAWPVVLLGVLLADVPLFRLGWSTLEPARLVDGVALTALWSAGLGLGDLAARAAPAGPRRLARPLLALALVVLAAALGHAGRPEPGLTLWPRGRDWPRLDGVSRQHGLPGLWAWLRRGSDRVLFVTSALRLSDDGAWYGPHSHVLSLAPLFAGREILHGTFTHPAPVAARYYTGQARPPARLDVLVEQLDGRQVLGQPLDRLDPRAFEAFARRLRVGTVVVPSAERRRARFLGDHYREVAEAAGFAVFEREERPWPRLERLTHRRYRVLVSPAGGVWVPTGIPAYPLWRAKSARGPLETRADAWGLLEIRVPLDVFEAELAYAEGWVEWASLGFTLAGVVIWGGWAWRSRAAGPEPATRGSAPARRRRDR